MLLTVRSVFVLVKEQLVGLACDSARGHGQRMIEKLTRVQLWDKYVHGSCRISIEHKERYAQARICS
jgi:hypothetical protein